MEERELIGASEKAFATVFMANFFYRAHCDKDFAEKIAELVSKLDKTCGEDDDLWRFKFGFALTPFIDAVGDGINRGKEEALRGE